MQKENFTIYRIDETDRITYVNPSWETFAKANNGLPSCGFSAIKGHSVCGYFSDAETEMIYQRIFEKVRSSQSSITFNIHCDSVTTVRILKTSVIPLPQNHLELRFKVTKERERDPYILINLAKETQNIISMCSYCGDLKDSRGNWSPIETEVTNQDLFQHALLPKISHGICPNCKVIFLESFHKNHRSNFKL